MDKKVNYSLLSDAELVEKAKTNPELYNVLLRRYNDSLLGYFLTKTSNFYLAETLRAKALEKAWKALRAGKYKERQKFENWIGIVGRNIWIDYLRKRKKRRKEVVSFVPLEKVAEVTEEITMTRQEKRKRMGMGLHALGRQCRLVIILVVIKRKKVEEVAKRLNIDVNSVYTYTYRGLTKLRMFF
jgi:RNA polymerase sigma factor (sigma-70 family)